jgi:hypothetical protein
MKHGTWPLRFAGRLLTALSAAAEAKDYGIIIISSGPRDARMWPFVSSWAPSQRGPEEESACYGAGFAAEGGGKSAEQPIMVDQVQGKKRTESRSRRPFCDTMQCPYPKLYPVRLWLGVEPWDIGDEGCDLPAWGRGIGNLALLTSCLSSVCSLTGKELFAGTECRESSLFASNTLQCSCWSGWHPGIAPLLFSPIAVIS